MSKVAEIDKLTNVVTEKETENRLLQKNIESYKEAHLQKSTIEEEFAEKLRQLSAVHNAQLVHLAAEEEAKLMHMRESLEAALEQERRGELERASLLEQLEQATIELNDLRSLRPREDREEGDASGDLVHSENTHLGSTDLPTDSPEVDQLRLQLVRLEEELASKEAVVAELSRRLEETSVSLAEAQSELEEVPELRAELEDLQSSLRSQAEQVSQRESGYGSELRALQEQAAVAMEEVAVLRRQLADHHERGNSANDPQLSHEIESNHPKIGIIASSSQTEDDLASPLTELVSVESQVETLKETIHNLQSELRGAHDRERLLEGRILEQQADYSSSSESLLLRLARMEEEGGEGIKRLESTVRELEEELQITRSSLIDKEREAQILVERHEVEMQRAENNIVELRADTDRMERAIEEARAREQEVLARLQELEHSSSEKESLLEERTQMLQSLERELDNAKSMRTQADFEELSTTKERLYLMQVEIGELKSQLTEARAERDAALSSRQEATGEVDMLTSRIAQMGDTVSDLRKALADQESVISGKDSEIMDLKLAVEKLEAALATSDHALKELGSRFQSERTLLEKGIEDRIITIASLEERLRECQSSLLSSEDKSATLQQSVVELSSQLQLRDNAISELNEALRVERAARCDEVQNLNAMVEEAMQSKKVSDDLVVEIKERNALLTDELSAAQRKTAELEELAVSLKSRADEAEAAVSIFESKKKRDLEFLRKQNETIASLQRQVEELKAAVEEKESNSRMAVGEAEKKLMDANNTILALQESLQTCQSEINMLKAQQERFEDTTLEAKTVSPGTAKSAVEETVERLRLEEERYKTLESKLNEMLMEKERAEASLIRRTEEMSHTIKSLQVKVRDLEEERERLEEEVRVYTNQVAEACREHVKYSWYRHSS